MAATAAWPAAASSGRRQSGSCGVQTRERRGGNSTGAHSGCSGGLGELGEAPEPTNLTKMAGGSEVEDDGDGGDAGAPAVCFSARRKRGSGRISWVLRVAVRSTVATANGDGDDELRSGACRERAEEGTGSRGREGRCRGRGRLRGVAREARERLGGSRRWPRRHRRSPPSCFGARGGRRQGGGRRWAGPAGGAGPATGKWPRWAAGNVSLPLSVFPILLLFSIFLTFV